MAEDMTIAVRPSVAWDEATFFVRGHVKRDDGTEELIAIPLSREQARELARSLGIWSGAQQIKPLRQSKQSKLTQARNP